MDTPTKTPGINMPDANQVQIMGGVDFSTENTYIPDPSDAAGELAKKASASRPADLPLTWNFDYNGETLTPWRSMSPRPRLLAATQQL